MEINGTEIMTHWDKEEINEDMHIIFRLLKMRGIIDADCFDWCDVEKKVELFEKTKLLGEEKLKELEEERQKEN